MDRKKSCGYSMLILIWLLLLNPTTQIIRHKAMKPGIFSTKSQIERIDLSYWLDFSQLNGKPQFESLLGKPIKETISFLELNLPKQFMDSSILQSQTDSKIKKLMFYNQQTENCLEFSIDTEDSFKSTIWEYKFSQEECGSYFFFRKNTLYDFRVIMLGANIQIFTEGKTEIVKLDKPMSKLIRTTWLVLDKFSFSKPLILYQKVPEEEKGSLQWGLRNNHKQLVTRELCGKECIWATFSGKYSIGNTWAAEKNMISFSLMNLSTGFHRQVQFSYPLLNIVYAGLIDGDTKYLEIDSKENTALVCYFTYEKTYKSYGELTEDCKKRDLTLVLLPGEYINEVGFRDEDGSMLLTIYKKGDILNKRFVWSYVKPGPFPDLDFEQYFHCLDKKFRFQIKKDLKNELEDLELKIYLSGATTYSLIKPNYELEDQNLFLTATDDDNQVRVSLSWIWGHFFGSPFFSENQEITVNFDDYNSQFEYPYTHYTYKTDVLTLNKIDLTQNSQFDWSPITKSISFKMKNPESDIPHLNPNILLDTDFLTVFRKKNTLDRLSLKGEIKETESESRAYFVSIDLTPLNIQIKQFSSSRSQLILFIKEPDDRISAIKFFKQGVYLVRQFYSDYLHHFPLYFSGDPIGLAYDTLPFGLFEYIYVSSAENTLTTKVSFTKLSASLKIKDSSSPLTGIVLITKHVHLKITAVKQENQWSKDPELLKKITVQRKKNQVVDLKEYFTFYGNIYYNMMRKDKLSSVKSNVHGSEKILPLFTIEDIPYETHLNFPLQSFFSFSEGNLSPYQVSIHHFDTKTCQADFINILTGNSLIYTFQIPKSGIIKSYHSVGINGPKSLILSYQTNKWDLFFTFIDLSNPQQIVRKSRTVSMTFFSIEKARFIGNNQRKDEVIVIFTKVVYGNTRLFLYRMNMELFEQGNNLGFRDIQFELLTLYESPMFFLIIIDHETVRVQAFKKESFPYIEKIVSKIEFTSKFPEISVISYLSCRTYKDQDDKSNKDRLLFECNFVADELYLYNFKGQIKTIPISEKIEVKIGQFNKYYLVGVAQDIRCETSKNFIQCESLIRDTNAEQDFFMHTTWPKIDGDYAGNGYTSRIEPLSSTLSCSDTNFRIFDYDTDKVLSRKFQEFQVSFTILKFGKPSLNLKVNLKGKKFSDVIETSKFILVLNPKSNEVLEIGTQKQFELGVDDPLLEITFIFLGIVILMLVTFLVCLCVKKREKTYNEEYVVDNSEDTGLYDEISDPEFGGGVRFQSPIIMSKREEESITSNDSKEIENEKNKLIT